MRKLLILVALLTTTAKAAAEDVFNLGLLSEEAVRKEIHLEPADARRIEAILTARGDTARDALTALAEGKEPEFDQPTINARARAQVRTLLTASQRKRLAELTVQRGGLRLFLYPEFAAKFNLTPEQGELIAALYADANRQPADPSGESTPAQTRAWNAQAARVNAKADAEVWRLLTRKQKAKWKAMKGEPFDGKVAR